MILYCILLSTTVDDKAHMGIMPLTLLHYALLVKLLFNFPASLKLPYGDHFSSHPGTYNLKFYASTLRQNVLGIGSIYPVYSWTSPSAFPRVQFSVHLVARSNSLLRTCRNFTGKCIRDGGRLVRGASTNNMSIGESSSLLQRGLPFSIPSVCDLFVIYCTGD
jgi:hypothetical protein